jgi:hypothetical protein
MRQFAEYGHFRDEAIRRGAGVKDPLAAERLLRSSLLLPTDPATLQSLDLPAQTVEKSLSSAGSGTNSNSEEAPWRLVSLALLDYRRGRWAEAVPRCQALASADTNPARLATARLILALSQLRLGQPAAAAEPLQQARESVEARFRAGLTAGSGAEGYWFEWAIAQILLREATGLTKSVPGG